ncbi:hypothetical protein ETAA8_38790 [Anatilimnocola aggregata]|uniref:Uncharacterized protein n=1 Tax=Anatilimnocola aggregata TaxID=2528021 RepID=A0A517YEV7_9BACT|nr:hypothetical protein [Anatilimnocola aggregata]QDU28774.1 hypothetical protein ETAA8_38790 [Anatilimnocola aggregata]
MALQFGTKLMGKVDEVPRIGHVSTQFFHVNYVPLIPTGSYFILEEHGDEFRGVQLPMSFKSILVAWLRAGLFVGFVAGVIGCIISLAEKRTDGAVGLGVLAAAAMAGFWGTYYIPLVSRASYQRAMEIAERIGLSDETVLMLEVAYGRKTAEEADLELEKIEERRAAATITEVE